MLLLLLMLLQVLLLLLLLMLLLLWLKVSWMGERLVQLRVGGRAEAVEVRVHVEDRGGGGGRRGRRRHLGQNACKVVHSWP